MTDIADLASRIVALERRRDGLHAQLRQALVAGDDTQHLRAFISDADGDIAELQAEHASAIALADDAALEKVLIAGRAIAETSIVNAISAVPSLEISAQMPDHHAAAIDTAAADIAAIAGGVDAADLAHASAKERVAVVEQRLAEKGAARQALISRRASGAVSPDDAGELLLLEADREGLQATLDQAVAEAARLQGPANEARRQLGAARERLAGAEREARADLLVDRARQLEAALQAVIGELDRTGGNPRPRWGATTKLRDDLRRLAMQRGEP